MTIAVLGAGAAGVFGAISACSHNPHASVIILEKTRRPLAKVKISGGGRCNVTHACFEPAKLVQNYPRGNKALLGPFTRFGPKDTIAWFQERGVEIKKEADGRMFPTTDSSQTIIDCLLKETQLLGIELITEVAVTGIERTDTGFLIHSENSPPHPCHKLLVATGSTRQPLLWLKELGHTIVPPVPSLFTFNIESFALKELAGISVPEARIQIEGTQLEQRGPLLITHWGFSGPAVLKLSAWGARILHDLGYKATVSIQWLANVSKQEIQDRLKAAKTEHAKKFVMNATPFSLPANLWKSLVTRAGIMGRWAEMSRKEEGTLFEHLICDRFQINGQTTYKEEFVTCGGVKLDEVNFKRMESKIVPNLFFAGEVLDIDGVTGGFNFQNAWTTGWIAGQAMCES